MTLEAIETLVVASLNSVIGQQADVRSGPVGRLPLGGMRETIFAHAVRFEDHRRIAVDGAGVGKRRVQKGRVAGIVEERPGRVVIEVSTIATAHARVLALSRLISPTVLLALASERTFNVGESANRLVSLTFSDFSPSLNMFESRRTEEGEVAYHTGLLVFHLEGTLHVLLTKQDGLRPSRPAPAVPAMPGSTPARRREGTARKPKKRERGT